MPLSSAKPKLSTTSDDTVDISAALLVLLIRMWGGSLTRVALFFNQVTLGVEFTDVALQYNWITDPATILWIPPLVWRRMFGRSVTVNWAEWKRKWTLNYVYYKCELLEADKSC